MPDDSLLRPGLRSFRRDAPARIGPFEVRAASNELVGPLGIVRLRPRLMDVLLRLAASPGEVVERQVLLDDVWPRRLVADEVLSRTIAELRTALSDDAREARFIETLPKVGYRLIAPVVAAERNAAPGGRAAAQSPPGPPQAPWNPRRADEAVTRESGRPARPRRGGQVAALVGVVAAALAVAIAPALRTPAAPGAPAVAIQDQLNKANPFSSDLAMETGPRFSPDGRRVAFSLGSAERGQIVVQDVSTRSRVVLGDASTLRMSPVFFPDGQRLAYYRRDGAGCAIVERSLASEDERVLVDCPQRPAPRFDLAPDGSRLVFATFGEGDHGLRMLDLASGRVTVVTQPDPGAGSDITPRFSPDGRRIAFMRGVFGFRDLWTVDVDDPSSARSTGSPRGLTWGFAWLGNDGPLLVAADWTGARALNLLDIRTGTYTLLGARGGQFPDASVRGDIVYESASYQANLQMLDATDAARPPQTLWPSAKYTNYPQFSPDGSQVSFQSNRDNVSSVFVGKPGADARRLPLPADLAYSQTHWSHDGRFIYAVQWRPGTGEGASRGVRIDPVRATVETLDALGDGVTDLRDSADGRMLYFATQDGPLMQLWRAPADALARRERLPLPNIADYDMQGDRLAYAEPRSADVTVCELPDLRCAPSGLPDTGSRIGFALAGDGLWVGYEGDPGEVVRFDLVRRAITLRLPHGPSAIGSNLTVSPDERHVIISRQEQPAIDLMIAAAPAARVAPK